MAKVAPTLVLFFLLCSLLVPVQEINVASAAEAYDPAVELPSGAHIHVYYEGDWSEEEKSVINEQLIIFLPRMCDEFWAIHHNASITIKLTPEGIFHGWGRILYDSHGEIVGYDGWIEIRPIETSVLREAILHELTHVFQFWIPNYFRVTGKHIEAVADAFSRALILQHFGWITPEYSGDRLIRSRGDLIFPTYYGAAGYLSDYASNYPAYDLAKGWTELWNYDPQAFKRYNTFVANLDSGTQIRLRDAARISLFEGYPDYSYDGYSVDDWLSGLSFFNSLSDIPSDKKMMYWGGSNFQIDGQAWIQFAGFVYMKQAENALKVPISSFDITIRDGQTHELLYSNMSQPILHDQVYFVISSGVIPFRNLLRIDLLVHCVDGEDLPVTAYLSGRAGYDAGYRVILFLNRDGYAEGTGSSNVGPIDGGYLVWKTGDDVEATVTWSNGTYTYVIGNIMADPAIVMHQMGVRLYESRTFLSPLAQIIDLDETAQLTTYVSPKVSSGNVAIYHSTDKENWAPIANVTPTNGRASYEYLSSQIGQHYFKASWTGDEIIDPSQSSIVRIDVVGKRTPSFISINTSALSSQIGFKVNLSGTLLSEYGNSLGNEIVNLYMIYNETKTPITIVSTDNAGRYDYSWTPNELGYYTIIAEWDGNPSYIGASNNVTLAFLSSFDQHVFTVESNSTISELNYNAANRDLNFTVNGSDGTEGYAKVTIAKNLAADIANLKVYLDSNEVEYSIAQTSDSWIITLYYFHSLHEIVIDLDVTVIPELSFPYIMLLFTITASLAIIFRRKIMNNFRENMRTRVCNRD